MDTQYPILYIASPPYSGSTLLTMLLATHPQIGTLGERTHYDRKMLQNPIVGSQLCSCGTPFRQCETWRTIQQQTNRQLPARLHNKPFSTFRLERTLPHFAHSRLKRAITEHAIQNRTHELPPPIRNRYNAMLQANASLIQATLTTTQTDLFLDSSKAIEQAVHLNRIKNASVKVIVLTRDGRAQVASTMKRRTNWGVERTVARWQSKIIERRDVLERTHIPHLSVRYEDVCRNPRKELNRIFDFSGLDGSKATLDVANETFHIMGNPMRLEQNAEIVDRQSWRKTLRSEHLELFERIAGKTNRSFGYV